MPTFPTLVVPMQLRNDQAVMAMTQLAIATGKYNVVMDKTNQGLQVLQNQMQGVARSAGAGFGGFMIMGRAMGMVNSTLKEGVRTAIDTDFSLTTLGLRMGITADQAGRLRGALEDITMAIGPLDLEDTVHTIGNLATAIGATTDRVMALAPTFGKFVSDIVELSEHRIDPYGAATIGRVGLNLFGGLTTSTAQQRTFLDEMIKHIGAFSPLEPGRWMTVFRRIAKPGQIAGLTQQDIFTLADIGTAAPITSRGGTDIAGFLNALIVGPTGHGKAAAAQEAARIRLGIDLPGGRHRIFQKGGLAGVLGAMGQALTGMDPEERAGLITTAIHQQLARNMFLAMAQDPQLLVQMMDKSKMGKGIEELVKIFQQTPRGQIDRFHTNIKALESDIFLGPGSVLGFLAGHGADFAQFMSRKVRQMPALGGLLGGGALAGGAGLSAGFLSMGLRSLFGADSLIFRGVAGFARGGIIGLIVTLVVSGILMALQQRGDTHWVEHGMEKFHHLIDKAASSIAKFMAGAMWQFFSTVIQKTWDATVGRIPGMSSEKLGAASKWFNFYAVQPFSRALWGMVPFGSADVDKALNWWSPVAPPPGAAGDTSVWGDQPGANVGGARVGPGGRKMPDSHREAVTARKMGDFFANKVADMLQSYSNSSAQSGPGLRDPYANRPGGN